MYLSAKSHWSDLTSEGFGTTISTTDWVYHVHDPIYPNREHAMGNVFINLLHGGWEASALPLSYTRDATILRGFCAGRQVV